MSPRDVRFEASRLPDRGSALSGGAPARAGQLGLWVFMGVVTVLFSLFAIAYLMRMAVPDWRALPFVPWQLWLSTALLAAGSVALQMARTAALRGRWGGMERAFACGCLAALAFLAIQLWAWEQMYALDFAVGANPANSFFYLITGLHGLHVAGGLVAAAIVAARLARGAGLDRVRAGIALCAQYWHFLLVLWLAVFGLLFLVTPEFVQIVCNSF
jgi:cytochrome c oxidase subunit 3